MSKKKKQKTSTALSRERDRQKAEGYFDGRYRVKVVPDKKKKAKKDWARKAKQN